MSKQLIQVDISLLMSELAKGSFETKFVTLSQVLDALAKATASDEQPQDKE